jgi:decaprenyl-phosphate phosphoribosyltransferase
MAIKQLLRVSNWMKNIFVLAPLIYSMKMFSPDAITNAFIAFAVFCLGSSSLYILNDIMDREEDLLHPRKKMRPIPSGKISVTMASIVMVVLFTLSIYGAFFLSTDFLIVVSLFLLNNVLYSFILKQVNLLDCFSVAISFVLRTIGGCYAINVLPSFWIIVITFTTALFLIFIKRKSEIIMLGDKAVQHRKVLVNYNITMLDQFIFITGAITLTGYIMYTINEKVLEIFGTHLLVYSSFFVFLGIFRFIQISNSNSHSNEGDPTTLILKDRFSQVNLMAYAVYVITIIYIK